MGLPHAQKQGEMSGQGQGVRSDSQMAMQLHQELNEDVATAVPLTLPPVTRSDSDMARALQAELDGTAHASPVYQGWAMPASVVQGTVQGSVMPGSVVQGTVVQGSAGTTAGGYTALYPPGGERQRTDSATGGVPAGIMVPPHWNAKETLDLPLLCGLLVAGGDIAVLSKSVARVLTLFSKSKTLSPVQGQLRKVGYASAVAAAFGNNLKVFINLLLCVSVFFFVFFFFPIHTDRMYVRQ